MQEQGIFFMFLITVIAPLVLLFSNHDIFFIAVALIISITSVVNIKTGIFGKNPSEPSEDEKEAVSDLEDYINLDLEKLGKGTRVVRHSIAIIFFVYSSFYIHSSFLRVMVALALVYWIYKILQDLLNAESPVLSFFSSGLYNFIAALSSMAMLLVIAAAALNKFSGTNL